MTLAFLNPSRSFDTTRNAVGFVGHDGMFEIRFFVEADALSKSRRKDPLMTESQYLAAFDSMRTLIQEAARKIYANHHRKLNILSYSDVS